MHVLLLLPTTSYRISDFLEAAGRLGVRVTIASEETSAVSALNPEGIWTLDFRDPDSCARRAVELARGAIPDAVLGVDEETAVAAAAIADAFSLPHNPVSAASAARHKPTMRAILAAARVPSPRYDLFDADCPAGIVSDSVRYPCVIKPSFLSGSRGVIRANDTAEFVAAWERTRSILREPDVMRKGGAFAGEILVEDFLSGPEVAVEGLLRRGDLTVLALFDKPDPLEGPFFEETIYVTPSRLPLPQQEAISDVTVRAARALGLSEGPIHAELRLTKGAPSVVEIAGRSIGGLCSRTLRFGTGLSLEEVILRHALGLPVETARDGRAAGVMMIPIPRAGRYEGVEGLERGRDVEGIEEITITMRPGQELVPLPEGWRYLGFIFSRADTPEQAEAALREAHAKLRFRIE